MSFVENIALKNDYFTRLEQDDEDGSEFTDRWNTGELLCLASAVQRSGDKNWVSVSRSIKPFGDPKRPSDWYTPKNCALQYSKLLKGVEDFKKKSLPRTERETSEELLVKNLTDKRITELSFLNQQTKVLANSLKVHMDMLECGEYDEHLDELLKQIEDQERKEEENFKEWIARRETLNASKKLNKCRVPLSKGKAPSRSLDSKRKNSPNPDQIEDISMHSTLSDVTVKTEVESDNEFTLNTKPIHIKQEIDIPSSINVLLEGSKASTIVSPSPLATTPTSPLLTSLLRSVPSNNTGASVVSYVNSPLKEKVKVESSAQSSNSSTDNTRKTEVFLSPTKTVMTGISPLLTSLLKSPTSAVPTSTSMASHSKEPDATDIKSGEIDMAALIAKSQETSPRSSASHSPRPTPASSPLLNSLLKSSPGSVSPLTSSQLGQTKDVSSSKTASSPQSFFNPTSALATAAAQQLAVATSTLPQSHVFFTQDASESPKRSLQTSPATSACLSAPTLSKLLEMPPSTPGRLPPLPIVETVANTPTTPVIVPEQSVTQSPKKSSTAAMLLNELELQISSSPVKKSSESTSSAEAIISDQFLQKKVLTSTSSTDKKSVITPSSTPTKTVATEIKVPFKRPGEIDDTSQENIDILEAVCESINQAFEKKEIKQEPTDPDGQHFQGKSKKESPESSKHGLKIEKVIPDDVINAAINIEKLISSDMGLDEKVFSTSDIPDPADLNLFEDDKQKSDIEIESPSTSIQSSEKLTDTVAEDKISGRKFYKSRTSKKRLSTEEDSEKSADVSPNKHTPKKFKSGKCEMEVLSQIPVNEQLLLAAKEAEEATMCKTPEKSPSKASENRSPVAKKPRIFEKTTPTREKKELSEDEAPAAKRPGRKDNLSAKKGRKVAKSTPVKQEEPKDQYEFSESTEENSVGYQAANTLCYMPRVKDDESKVKQSQSSEDNGVASGTPAIEKKHVTPTKIKTGKVSQPSARKNLYTSDEERLSDSMTSDDASNSHFGEDKLKTWKEYNEKKDNTKENVKSKGLSKGASLIDSAKKKLQQTKRNLFSSKNETGKKVEKKSVSSDVEESSACSRDSEDAASSTTWQRDDGEAMETKNTSPNVTGDVEVEANDSRLSSSVTVESDKPLDEMEGYESLQGSVTTEFSPLPQSEIKEEKDLAQFGKQDWYQGVSPKSSEPVSQSSEESEYESDNWDNQSVSTNKSASHSAGPSSKLKRKERESPQYKAWKKAISIVLREASCHKYANVFLQKVTNDVAPGYLSIVYRPMDLSLLKKNVDNGVVRTTAEVHRDMLLMFQNAVMYNSSDHDVHHMAIEMQRDVIQQIIAFLTTQFNDRDESNEPTSSLRGARSAKSQKNYGSASKPKEDDKESLDKRT